MTRVFSKRHIFVFDVLRNWLNVSNNEVSTDIRLLCTTPPSIHKLRLQMSELVGDKAAQIESIDIAAAFEEDQKSLRGRHMSDSYTRAMIPLGGDIDLREKYRTSFNTVRIGRILEDLDTLAGLTCFQHNKKKDTVGLELSPVAFVTAMVDRVDVHPETVGTFYDDITLSGMITWVGTSSMLVSMLAEQHQADEWRSLISAKFVMVGRNVTGGSAKVNPLIVESDQEKALFKEGLENKMTADKAKTESLLKMAPTEGEREYIHQMFLETIDHGNLSFSQRTLPPNSCWMGTTKLKNMIVCHPERRNMYCKIFGGFLMREAFELAWANASVFSKSRPRCIAIDDIVFKRPVEIGSLLYLSSQVVYTCGQDAEMRVNAAVVDPVQGSQDTSNIFYFTFRVEDKIHLPRIVPKTYSEAMLHLDGKRHYEESTRRTV